jgi:hypothetical protein
MIVNRKSLKLSAKLKPGMPPRGRQVKYPGSCSFLLFIFLAVWPVKAQVALAGPNGEVLAKIEADLDGALCYSVTWKGMTTISRSRMGVTRDGIDLGKAVQIGSPMFSAIDETYPVLGGKRAARNHARALSLPLEAARVKYELQARAYDEGFAWRIVVHGTGPHRVNGEASSWTLPPASKVWYGEGTTIGNPETTRGSGLPQHWNSCPPFPARARCRLLP